LLDIGFGDMRYVAPVTDDQLQDFARRYAAAWCSHDPDSVAAFFSEDGSLAVNGQEPAVGRSAISAVAQGFYDAFPDTVVILDCARVAGDRAVFLWTYEGTNSGPGGTGHAVRFNGWEQWTFGEDGLVALSDGRFDTVEYERQLAEGI
jgi:uncharacterized protein (TIGR02246 family)